MTCVMPGHTTPKGGGETFELEYVYNEGGEFVSFTGYRIRTLPPLFIVGKQIVKMLDHRNARARRRDDVIGIRLLKYLDKRFGKFSRLFSIAGIECWLPATCLAIVEHDFATSLPQNLDSAQPHIRKELIDQTGNEE